MRRRLTPVDRVGVDERAAVLGKRSIKAESQQAAIRMAVSMVEEHYIDRGKLGVGTGEGF